MWEENLPRLLLTPIIDIGGNLHQNVVEQTGPGLIVGLGTKLARLEVTSPSCGL